MAFAGKGYLGKHGSGVFACPVSGTHEFDAASFTLLQNHLEGDGPNEVGGKTTSPLLLFRGGVYKVQDSRLYTLANPARPCIEVDDTEVANRATDLTLDMTRFLQRLDEPGAAGEAEPGGNLLGVAIKLKGFSKQSTLKLINVRGECFQQTSAASQFDSRSKIGIRIESDDEGLQTQLTNRRVMIASTDCIIRYNTSTSSWEVRPLGGNNDSVTTHRFSTPNLVLSKFASGSTQAKAAPTTRAAGKHYYRGYAVDDRGRKTNMGAEKLVTLAAGEVPNVEIEAGQACRFILEHGTAEGVFTDWVEIVLPQGQAYLADMGSAIGGAAWSTEGKPTAQTTAAAENNTATGRVLLDSNGVAESFGPEIPTTGSWQKAGDLYTLTPSGIRCVCATSAIANNGGTWIALLVGANELTAGESTVPRESAAATTIAATTKLLRLAFFTARKSETIKTLRVVTTATAAAATPSLIRLGVYSVSEAGALALVASTPSDTTLLAAANTRYSKNLSATWAKVAGSRYAIGLLVVTTAAAPTIAAISSSVGSTEAGESPRLCA
ncbi:MAG TPA: hypothetical protein VK572_07920, partial [Burkholderiales bacterium]|nr:hypothetical protein [Burkholderiales bacterium]